MFKALQDRLKDLFRGSSAATRGSPADIPSPQGEVPWWRLAPKTPDVGNAEAARYAAAEALSRDPNDVAACYQMGMIELGQRQVRAAQQWFERAALLQPDFAPAHFGLGMALRDTGEQSAALTCFKRAIELKHDYVEAYLFAAELHAAGGETEDAEDCYQLALAFDDNCQMARFGLSELLVRAGQTDNAAGLLREVIAAEPSIIAAYCQLGQLLGSKGRLKDAVAVYEDGLRAVPDDPLLLVNLGYLYLTQIGNARHAEGLFRRAVQRDPLMMDAHANLGLAVAEQGRPADALRYFEEVISAHPDVAEFRWNRGVVLLASGNFELGWEDYEIRKIREGGKLHRDFPFPEWNGSSLHGTRILIYGEQGLGDIIMFASCLPDVIGAAERCVIECDVRLESLFRRSFPAASVQGTKLDRERTWLERFPDINVQCAIGSLPRFLRRSQTTFPRHHGYLVADPARVEKWQRLIGRQGPMLNVGIAWRGGIYETRRELRSTRLLQWAPVLSNKQARYFSLQRGDAEELRHFRAQTGLPIHEFDQTLEDLDEMAAAIAALDLVVSVDNTNVHLAGALGRPVWVLLSANPDWRYFPDGSTMPWYPSARLFRQPQCGDWAAVMRDVCTALDDLKVSRSYQ